MRCGGSGASGRSADFSGSLCAQKGCAGTAYGVVFVRCEWCMSEKGRQAQLHSVSELGRSGDVACVEMVAAAVWNAVEAVMAANECNKGRFRRLLQGA